MFKLARPTLSRNYVLYNKCEKLNPTRFLSISALRHQEAAKKASSTPATTSASQGNVVAFRSRYFAPTGLTPFEENDPARDLKNYPRENPVNLYPAQHKFWFFPRSWFDALYAKTGVSGPYVFGGGLVAFLLSKELWVLEHEVNTIAPLVFLCLLAKKYLVPQVHEYISSEALNDEKKMVNYQEDAMKYLEQEITVQDNRVTNAEASKYIVDAKKENVLLQMEAEYRSRLNEVYNATKNRLDYFVAVQNSKRRFEREHMINWIGSGVRQSITDAAEKDNMKQCVSKLAQLAVSK